MAVIDTVGRRSAESRLWFVDHSGTGRKLWQSYHSASLDRLRTGPAGRCSCANRSARKRPVADASLRATSSGVPCRDDAPAADAAFGSEVDDVVGRLDDVEVVLDDDDPCCPGRRACSARRAACACPRSAGRSSARRGCRASGRCRAATAPSPASRAAPRRRDSVVADWPSSM